MYGDIAVPNNNEAELLEIASKLGIEKLYFFYDFDKYGDVEKVKGELNKSHDSSRINIEICLVAGHRNLGRAAGHSRILAAKSSGNDRAFIESRKIKIIYGFEEPSKKDFMHQRASGLNHTLCELARKNNVAVGFSYSSLLNKSSAETSLLIGRMMQNISLCQKYNVKTAIGSFSGTPLGLRAPKDIIGLFTTLGMDGKKIKDSMRIDL